ncbi:D-alanyl-D-alanine carboxypeptidase [Deltaproteobacteria bacterium TL4]
MIRKKQTVALIGLLLWAASIFANPTLDSQIAPYIKKGSVIVANEEEIVYEYHSHPDELLIPASILKYATALAAFHYLGKDFRFKTEFYLRASQDILVRGYGDPFLVSEEWEAITNQLKQRPQLPRILGNILLDDSSFAPKLVIHGIEYSLNPYDAPNGALVTNFNTINVEKLKNGDLRTAELQTPLTPLAYQLSKTLAPGIHRINISRRGESPLPYVGQLFQAFLEKKGYHVSGKILNQTQKSSDELLYTHWNERTLQDTIAGMMLYSNNYTANQLMLTLGAVQQGYPTTVEKGVQVLRQFLEQQIKLTPQQFHLVEGSGISRKNLFSPRAMIPLLRAFKPYKSLLGQLNGVFLKTGTLQGVYTMAGYLPTPSEPLYFVIMLNQTPNNRRALLEVLEKNFLSTISKND